MTLKAAIPISRLTNYIAYTTLSANVPLTCPRCGLTFGTLYSNAEKCPEAHCLNCFEILCGLTGEEKK